MVSMRRLPGPKNPAEMTYYAQLNGAPITGTTAAKTLTSLDSQTMALTLGYFVQVQAERKLVTHCTSAIIYNCTRDTVDIESFIQQNIYIYIKNKQFY